jgi:transposase
MPPGPVATVLKIPRRERRRLKLLARRHRTPQAVAQRARMLLLVHQGIGTTEIAWRLGCSSRNVRKWKARFSHAPRAETLEDQERSGRPARIPIVIRCKLVQLACERPEGQKSPVPFRDIWTYGSLADALETETGHRISVSEVGRILRFEKLRPHRIRQWLKSSDPQFLPKAKRICNLYLRVPKNAVVVCVDEKPMQVLERKHPTHVDPRDGSIRYEYEYKRHGTQCLLAAFNVKTGRVFGRVVRRRTAKALVSFMNALARRYPDKTVYVVWDNLNIHYDGKDNRWTRFNERHGSRFRFVYTPKHASWMNQVEIWFSILDRRILKHGDFANPLEQAQRVEGFVRHWNRWERHPFRWKWRTEKLRKRRPNHV